MARGSKGSFPKWATPLTERKLHGTDPCWEPDNAIAYPKAPNTMGWPIPQKTAGYKIGTKDGGNSNRWHRDGRKG